MDVAYEDKLNGVVSAETYMHHYGKLKGEQSSLEQKHKSLLGSEDTFRYDTGKVKDVVNSFLNAEEYSRALLISLIERIELTKDKEVLIYFKFRELDMLNH